MRAHRGGSTHGGRPPLRITEQQLRVVSRICHARLRSTDVEDAIQETLLQYVLADRSRIANPDGWLATVATRVCAQTHRRRYRRQESPIDERLPDPSIDPCERATTSALLSDMASALPASDYHILRRVYFEDLPFAQLATELNVTEPHARVLAFRARRRAALLLQYKNYTRTDGDSPPSTPLPRPTADQRDIA